MRSGPELLRALKQLIAQEESEAEFDHNEHRAAVEFARHVIAKAETPKL